MLKTLDMLSIAIHVPFWMDPDYEPSVWTEPPFTDKMRKERAKLKRRKPTLLDKYLANIEQKETT